MGPGVSRELATRTRREHLRRAVPTCDLSLVVTRHRARNDRHFVHGEARAQTSSSIFAGRGSPTFASTAPPRRRNSMARIFEYRLARFTPAQNEVTASFTTLIAPAGASIIRFHDDTRRRRLPLHVARAVGRERALSLLRPARSQGAPHAVADGADRMARDRQRHHASGSTRPTRCVDVPLPRDRSAPHVSLRVRCRTMARVHGRPAATRTSGCAPRARARSRWIRCRRRSRSAHRVAPEVFRRAVSVPAIPVHAVAGVSVRRHGASGRHDVQRGVVHLPRAADAQPAARPTGDDLSRGRAPLVRRRRDDALVRRPLAQGRLRHLHGGEDAGHRGTAEPLDVVLPAQQAGRVRRRPDRPARRPSGSSSPISIRPRATTARSSTTRRRAFSSSSTIWSATPPFAPGFTISSSRTPTATRRGRTCSRRSARRRIARSPSGGDSTSFGRDMPVTRAACSRSRTARSSASR